MFKRIDPMIVAAILFFLLIALIDLLLPGEQRLKFGGPAGAVETSGAFPHG